MKSRNLRLQGRKCSPGINHPELKRISSLGYRMRCDEFHSWGTALLDLREPNEDVPPRLFIRRGADSRVCWVSKRITIIKFLLVELLTLTVFGVSD